MQTKTQQDVLQARLSQMLSEKNAEGKHWTEKVIYNLILIKWLPLFL